MSLGAGTFPDMICAMFPGQGSQKPGMGREVYEASEAARAVFAEASEGAGRDLAALCFESDEDTLRQTENAQPALYVCGVAHFRASGLNAGAAAGHSVGEYAALAAAGVLSVADGARLVSERGRLMVESGQSAPGTMAAVLGLSADQIQTVLDRTEGTVVIANDNCPGQLVISGEIAAVEAASAALKEVGAKRVLPLNVSGAFHSPLMVEPARRFRAVLDSVSFHKGRIPVVANVTAAPVADPSEWPALLEAQLSGRVRWTESVRALVAMGVTEFREFGVGEVLCGLVKRTDASVTASAG